MVKASRTGLNTPKVTEKGTTATMLPQMGNKVMITATLWYQIRGVAPGRIFVFSASTVSSLLRPIFRILAVVAAEYA